MATIKNTTSALGNLINTINAAGSGSSSPASGGPTFASSGFGMPGGFGSGTIGIDDGSIPSDILEPEPMFTMNYRSSKKQCVKRAKDQLTTIVNEVVPALMQDSKTIVDKICQDAETLGSLYYEYEKNEKIIQSIMQIISRGETSPRIFDVYAKMAEAQNKLISKITETQNQLRKYYIDTYLDIQQKDHMDDQIGIAGNSTKAIEGELPEEMNGNKTNVMVGTSQAIKMINERKKQALIANYEEVKD